MTGHFICIHGHFYQPPREDPWSGRIEAQPTAAPYHDWNERITAECYGPNTRSRILGDDEQTAELVNNYARMSFNFGPTLLSWLQSEAPEVYASILAADRESRERFSGHGSALAQAYNHMIMPLASRRDKVTQVIWGKRDFEHRFGRPPEGMWLPETAVDVETLEVLAEGGIAFTILAPKQASRVRRIGSQQWRNVGGGNVDPTMPYVVPLPSGRSIAVFFYDGAVSHEVAFNGLLEDGARLAVRLQKGFRERKGPQLVHIATDGESYGHHHEHGDMALAFATRAIEQGGGARLTNYGELLSLHPPTHEACVVEDSSWSCLHGIERWRDDCGCEDGGHPGWHQAWRRPLRDSLDWLRDRLAALFEEQGEALLSNPWAARDAYIKVVLDRSDESVERFLAAHAAGDLDQASRTRVLDLLEMQRHAMLMFTSCGWFFDDLARIEGLQILRYAMRAMQLAREEALKPGFLIRLAWAHSNHPQAGSGKAIFEDLLAARDSASEAEAPNDRSR